MLYEIFEGNMERLQKRLARIENKCKAYGCEFSYKEIGETFKEIKDEETGKVSTARFIQVDVSGTAQVNNWEFIATIQHSKPFNIIRSFRPEVEIPEEYYTADTRCDHCNTKRNRKDTYLIHNIATGEFKQVGKTCLKEFTNGLSAEAVAEYIAWFNEAIKGQQPIPGFTKWYTTEEVLQYAVEAISLYGYNKTYCSGVSTVSIVREQKFQLMGWEDRVKRDGFNVNRVGNDQKAKEILSWVSSLPDELGYITNLKVTCNREFCENRDFGLICSAVAAYNREMEKQSRQKSIRKSEEMSVWVGNKGERIELRDLSIKLLTGWETQFGYTYLYKFTDAAGNIYTWKTGKWLGDPKTGELSESAKVSLKGTIKEHSEFRGVKQTELTRCTIL